MRCVNFFDGTDKHLVHFEPPISDGEVLYFPKGQQIPEEWMNTKDYTCRAY